MKCESCKQEHDGSYGSGKYCNRSCANKRERSEEVKQKISLSSQKERESRSVELKKEIKRKVKSRWDAKILERPFETLTFERLKRRIVLEQDHTCNKCKLKEWLGEQITLELEHKDGNNQNNERENLECLCPNCHSLTLTWKGRNKRNNKNLISDETLCLSLVKNKNNIRQTLLENNLSAKGGNYKRCHRLIKLLEAK